MRFRFILIIILCLSFSVVACDTKREIAKDNVTADLPIESVATENNNKDITEGNALFAQGDYGQAIEFYRQAMMQNKATALYNIGVSYYLMNNIDQAELNFREAVEADPAFQEAVMNLVAVLAQQEKISEAEKYITRIIHTSKSARVYVDMANIALKQNETAKAAYYYSAARKIAPESPFVLSNYANSLISIGAYQDGIDILEQFNPKDFPINYNLANAYFLMKDNGGAYSYAREALYSPGATEEGYNKLAYLFSDLGYYGDEAKTLRIIISKNPTREYKIRLVTSYINSGAYDEALDELSALLAEYPNDIPLNLLNYDILIFSGKIPEAGTFIRALYKRLPDDAVLYYYVKHLACFERKIEEVRPLIFVPRDNGWLNLARTAYSLHKGDYVAAKNYLAKSPESAGHDYYTYKAFLAIKDKQFKDAEVFAAKMDSYRPDTFWYRLITAWNLSKGDDVMRLTDEYRNNPIVHIRSPYLRFNLKPRLADMSFTYRFDDKGVDVASMLAYPIFLEPDEIVQFLVMGRATLKDSEKAEATKKLEGMKRNNEGVDAFYAFDFDTALKKFNEASQYLAGNSYVAYNTGLALFNMGENAGALENFAKSVKLDPVPPQGQFGLGLINARLGNVPAANAAFDSAIKLAQSGFESGARNRADNIRLYYLGVLASQRVSKRNETAMAPKTDDAFVLNVGSIIDYFDGNYDTAMLEGLKDSPVFRAPLVRDLLLMWHSSPDTYMNVESKDRYYTLAKQFIALARGGKNAGVFNEQFAKDKVYLKDKVYGAVYLNDKNAGLRYLQTLSNIDYKYPELYKVSLYYFTWLRDFVNAEASYGSLDRINYRDQMTEFYMLLYFLTNYSEDRLASRLKIYEEEFGTDYRSNVITAAMNLNTKNLSGFQSIMSGLLKSDPYLFDKIFIEVDFDKF